MDHDPFAFILHDLGHSTTFQSEGYHKGYMEYIEKYKSFYNYFKEKYKYDGDNLRKLKLMLFLLVHEYETFYLYENKNTIMEQQVSGRIYDDNDLGPLISKKDVDPANRNRITKRYNYFEEAVDLFIKTRDEWKSRIYSNRGGRYGVKKSNKKKSRKGKSRNNKRRKNKTLKKSNK